ncbi:NADP-dependent oxidoreductase [Gracilaria domingensis]|nr:NADP-dependent oxidoreductase [Gracilaria domingensis]
MRAPPRRPWLRVLAMAACTRRVALGASALRVSPVCLGTMTWGMQNNEEQAHAQIEGVPRAVVGAGVGAWPHGGHYWALLCQVSAPARAGCAGDQGQRLQSLDGRCVQSRGGAAQAASPARAP